jgi:hypothetical protein
MTYGSKATSKSTSAPFERMIRSTRRLPRELFLLPVDQPARRLAALRIDETGLLVTYQTHITQVVMAIHFAAL